jgi:Fe-S oxidoreductase/nitrate reductase gamma subunit
MTPYRASYWSIESVWIFYILAAVAAGVFLFGVISHVSVWTSGVRRQGIRFSGKGILNLFLDGLLGKRIFSGDVAAGTMHFLILWGFIGLFAGTLLISADYWVYHFLKGPLYLRYSLCLEFFGLMLTIGLLWALIRRYLQRVTRLERKTEDLIVPVWLFAVVISGFLVEGVRLSAQSPEWGKWSFIGHWISLFWADPKNALSIYPYLWWSHALLSLGFVAVIPFCKLFHLLSAPLSIYLENQPDLPITDETTDGDEEVFSIRQMIFFDACTRCGRCVEVCPSTGAGEPFAPREFIAATREDLLIKHHPLKHFNWFTMWSNQRKEGKPGFDPQRLWHCTTCRACLEVCPVYVSTPGAVERARSRMVEEGTKVPPLLTQTLEKLYKYNNPWEASKKNRAKWSQDIEIPDLTKTGEKNALCYFVGCTTSLDTRAQDLARSFARILKHAGIPFGTLGKKEPCCGDIARRVGEEGLFEEQMEGCLALFEKNDIRSVVTSSPHCFHTFKNEYPAFQALRPPDENVPFQVRHYTQVINELVSGGSLRFEKPLNMKVTYHDPCYLGRHNKIYDAPREVIASIPGLELVEMTHNRENSLCCGGGGGRMWQEDLDSEIKMSEIRIREAAETGAETIITACPLCLIMLEDARKTAGLEDTLQLMDLNELVAMALGLSSENED